MLSEKFAEAVNLFQSLDGVEKAAFSFWGLCVALFYGTVIYIIFSFLKVAISKLKRVKV
jgi:hypothetical protein